MPTSASDSKARRARWVAIVTGAVSILIALLYLGFVTLLDLRGPLLPPPPEALAVSAISADGGAVSLPAAAAAVPPRG
jgi:hypothetical protein